MGCRTEIPCRCVVVLLRVDQAYRLLHSSTLYINLCARLIYSEVFYSAQNSSRRHKKKLSMHFSRKFVGKIRQYTVLARRSNFSWMELINKTIDIQSGRKITILQCYKTKIRTRSRLFFLFVRMESSQICLNKLHSTKDAFHRKT